MPLIDQILGAFDHREGFEAQEIEFDEPDLFDVSHRILSDDFVVGSFVERHVVRERPFRNDHAGGVSRGGVPGQSFEGAGDAHQLFHPRIGFDEIAQFRFLIECLLERNVELIRYELSYAIDFGIGNFQHAAHIPDRGSRPERPERNDLGYVVLAVLVDHVVDDLAPAFHAEVHVDIGEGHALGIQEPFEQ